MWNSRHLAPWLAGLAVSIGVIPIVASLLPQGGQPPAPSAIASEPNQRIVADRDRKPVVAAYLIHNVGQGAALELGPPTTSCGCSVASIHPQVVPPGQHAKVIVEGSPPEAREIAVRVRIPTNDPRGDVILRLTMVGAAEPPFVVSEARDVRLGSTDPGAEAVPIFIETREFSDRPAWLGKVTDATPGLEVHGGFLTEQPLGGEVVARQYRYWARLSRAQPPGEFAGLFILGNDELGVASTFAIRVTGTVRPPVYALPARLYASAKKGERPPPLTVMFSTSDKDFTIRVEPSPTTSEQYEIRTIATERGRVLVQVLPKAAPARSGTQNLEFNCNHEQVKQIRVPVTYHVEGA